ncbi:MAG: V-type ATP synthase subunit B, partial [Oscillospiraceae bacterium]|nr:V-type ATP synthase subunit B [Oscillospiraceae bacterium]
MIIEYTKICEINGSLIVVDDVKNPVYEEIAHFFLDIGEIRTGRVVKIDGKKVTLQVFEGTR